MRRFLFWGLPITALVVGLGLWLTFGPDPPLSREPPPIALLTVATADGLPTDEGLQLLPGDTLALVATAFSADGSAIPNPALAWRSTNDSLATIEPNGRLIALATGTLTVTASVDDILRDVSVSIGETPSDPNEDPESTHTTRTQTEQVEPDSLDEEPTPTVPTTPPLNGELALNVRPYARVLIDGVVYGEDVQKQVFSIPPGRHRLRLENEYMVPFDTLIVIRSGARTELAKTMQRKQ